MKVHVLVSIPDPELFDSCTLCFETLRVGFPTAEIHVYTNGDMCNQIRVDVYTKAKKCIPDVRYHAASMNWHHADWIEQVLQEHDALSGPCVIVDPDTIFWKSCEDWSFETPIAGYYVPLMWNDFAQCVSFERLHTSFLWIQDTFKLFKAIRDSYPNAEKETGEYCPVNPFMPRVQFIKGTPFFWDSTAALYNMIGGTHFSEEHLACYEHLNSASFYKVMHERLENRQGFEFLHKHLVKTPEQLRGLWNIVHPYYAAKHQQALQYLQSLETPVLRSLKLVLP